MSNASHTTFMAACLQGEALLDEIDDYVERWHEGGAGELHDYLGLTDEEFGLWVEQPSALAWIVAGRRRHVSVATLLAEEQAQPVAARAANADEAVRVFDWLRRNNRL